MFFECTSNIKNNNNKYKKTVAARTTVKIITTASPKSTKKLYQNKNYIKINTNLILVTRHRSCYNMSQLLFFVFIDIVLIVFLNTNNKCKRLIKRQLISKIFQK